MKKLLCIFLLFAFAVSAQTPKKYPSLLWKISGKGLKKPSYLYGTMHVSNRVAYHLSEQFFDALKSVDVVGLETNPGDWMENMHKTGEISQQTQFAGTYLYQRDFYRTVFSSNFPDKRLLQTILSYDPEIINGLLYRHSGARENFEENTYIDLFIFQSASKMGKILISLEDFVQSEIKARLSALPDSETGADEEESGGRKTPYYGTQKIEDAYRAGDLDLLDSLSKRGSSKNTQKYLINDRNVFFVHTIDSVLKTKAIFAGVGAAHLPGEDGVIELLRKLGYTVESVQPKNASAGDQERDKLEAQIKPVTFTRQFISDSLFSVAVPGRLSKVLDLESVNYHVYADMVNGSFYTIVRMKYFGPLFHVSPDMMLKKVDSLFFEHIPGKIIQKKEITGKGGMKGIEIVNKTRRGDLQHYQIYFNENEMIVFKMGGKLEYANGNEAKQFFGSIQFSPKSDALTLFSPPAKGFSVKVPAGFSYIKNGGSSAVSLVEDLYSYSNSDKKFYGVKHAVYNDFDYLEVDTFELNMFSRAVLKNFKFDQEVKREITSLQGLPALKFTAKDRSGSNLTALLVIKGVHYYFVYTIGDGVAKSDKDFFDSFTITDFVSTQPIKEITDKEFYFKALDEVSDNSGTRFNDFYAKTLEKVKEEAKGTKKKEDPAAEFDYRSNSKYYYSPSSNEYVNIVYERFNDYDNKTLKELEDILLKNVKQLNSLIPANIRRTNKDGLFTFEMVLKDTATSRAIAFKMLVKDGMRYEISTPYDTTIGLKAWAKGFYDSFKLTDTVIGKDITKSKFSLLVNDLQSSDTLVKRKANTSIQNSVPMRKEYMDEYVKLLASPDLAKISEDSRAQMFVNSGTLESEKIIEPYKKLYTQYTDSFYLQLSLLKGLAYLKTTNSRAAFLNLLKGETPLVGAENVVADLFNVLHDSLELARSFYPAILNLTRYDEYKAPIYSLLAHLVSRGFVKETVYTLQKENILADAVLAQKRYNPSNKSSANDLPENDYLDKSSKELAELMQMSLEGLSNNNYAKGNESFKNQEAASRHELVNYAVILAPFYKTDEKVKQYFARLSKIKAQNIALPLFVTLLKKDIVLNDTLLHHYCKNKTTRAYFYSELEKEKLLSKFEKQYLDQQGLVESVIATQRQFAKLYSYEKDKKLKDSAVYFKTLNAGNRYQKGKLFIYRIPKSKFDEESWVLAFVNGQETKISTDIEIINLNYIPEKSKTTEETINDILNEYSTLYRKRAFTGSNVSSPPDYD
jgi:uncharacterized protein YbaP (TraB family)